MKLQFNININIINYSNKIILIFFSNLHFNILLLNY